MHKDDTPAFPCDIYPGEIEPSAGMTMRDYFAAKAMQGFAVDDDAWSDVEYMAECAYKWADAMIKARGAV